MSFGLTNAPATFQRMIDEVIQIEKDICKGYMDDLITGAPDLEKHLASLRRIFDRLTEAGLSVRFDKCKFAHRNWYILDT